MINIHSKYDNMHRNEIFYALIYINNHVITSITCTLSIAIVEESSITYIESTT